MHPSTKGGVIVFLQIEQNATFTSFTPLAGTGRLELDSIATCVLPFSADSSQVGKAVKALVLVLNLCVLLLFASEFRIGIGSPHMQSTDDANKHSKGCQVRIGCIWVSILVWLLCKSAMPLFERAMRAVYEDLD